jgi:uncharacterized Zn-binding protein involved in type VI secretion
MLRTALPFRPIGVLVALVLATMAPSTAWAQAGELTDDEVCGLTPSDGSWALGPAVVDRELSILGIEPHDVSVPEASAACSNLFQYFDGTWIYVGVYLLSSAEAAREANETLRSSAAAAAPVEEFATPLLGDEAWIAHFEFSQLAFTRVGSFLIGGHSDEAYDYSRADYNQLLIERMGIAVTRAGAQSETVTDSGGTTLPTTPILPPTGSDADSSGVPGAVVGVGAAAAAAVAAVAIQRSRRRRRSGGDQRSDPQEEEQEKEPTRSVILALTHPAGRSPLVFQFGWIFGARCIVDAGTPNERDLSDTVRWSGTAVFNPPVGRLSRPLFKNEAGLVQTMGPEPRLNTITLTVDVDGAITERTIPVNVVRTVEYARVTDFSFCPADAHGCPACAHPTKGPIMVGSPNVSLDNLPAARVGDMGVAAACCGPNMYKIVTGDPRVLIDGKPAARKGSQTKHCGGDGKLISGSAGGPP